MINITPQELATVQLLIATTFPDAEARVFGSRYNGAAKPYSDLDIVLVGEGKLDWLQVSRLREDFAESDLPYRVDLLDWHAVSPTFQQIIAQGFAVIQESG